MNTLLYFGIVYLATVNAAVDIEKTVQRVQNILQHNTQLPRLTRGEILQLLRDIRAEDAKSSSKNQETKTDLNEIDHENEASNSTNESDIVSILNKNSFSKPEKSQVESTTKKTGHTITVVLPYTPRDGSSLQELYTRPPRVEVVPIPKHIKNFKKTNIRETLNRNAQLATKAKKQNLPEELQQFLSDHGIENKPGQDTFLLPLDGFKPLPLAKSSDNLELPKDILMTYDLITPVQATEHLANGIPPSYKLYEPLKPDFPFELDGSASELDKTVLPLDLPQRVNIKAVETTDYDLIKVLPLNHGPLPGDSDNNDNLNNNDLNKRQTTNDTSTTLSEITTERPAEETTIASDGDSKTASTNDVPATLSSASITDLEDSFGGAAQSEPGDSELPPPKKNGFYWMLDWNSFLEVGDGDTKVNIRFEPKLGDPQMFLPVNVP